MSTKPWDFTPIVWPPEDLELFKHRVKEMSVQEIAEWFGVPTAMVMMVRPMAEVMANAQKATP